MRLRTVEHGHRLPQRLKLLLIRLVSGRRVLPAGVLRSPDVCLDAGGDARAVGVERGRAGAVRRVHVAPEPVLVLNGRPRRGRVAGPQGRAAGRGGAGRLAHRPGRSQSPSGARLPREAHAGAGGAAAGGRSATPRRGRERPCDRGRDSGLRALQYLRPARRCAHLPSPGSGRVCGFGAVPNAARVQPLDPSRLRRSG